MDNQIKLPDGALSIQLKPSYIPFNLLPGLITNSIIAVIKQTASVDSLLRGLVFKAKTRKLGNRLETHLFLNLCIYTYFPFPSDLAKIIVLSKVTSMRPR